MGRRAQSSGAQTSDAQSLAPNRRRPVRGAQSAAPNSTRPQNLGCTKSKGGGGAVGFVSPYLGASRGFPTPLSLPRSGETFHPASPLTTKWGDLPYSVPPHFEVGGTFHPASPLTSKWGGLSIQCSPSLRSGGGDFPYSVPPHFEVGGLFIFFCIFKKKSPMSKVGGDIPYCVPPSFKVGGDKWSSPPPQRRPCL